MAAAHCAHPSGRTSRTPGPPRSRSQPPSLGLYLPASGLATRNPAPPEPLLLLVTVGCPSERRAPTAPHPGGIFHSEGGWGEGGGEKGVKGEAAGKGGGGLAGASGGAGVPELGPEGGRLRSFRQSEGTGPRAGGLALSVTAPSGPILPGRRCPWMWPPRAPRPVSLPAAPRPALPAPVPRLLYRP